MFHFNILGGQDYGGRKLLTICILLPDLSMYKEELELTVTTFVKGSWVLQTSHYPPSPLRPHDIFILGVFAGCRNGSTIIVFIANRQIINLSAD